MHFGDTVSNGMIGLTSVPGAGNTEEKGDEDVYTFTVPAGGTRVVFTVTSPNDWQMTLLDSAGRNQIPFPSSFVNMGPLFLAADSYRLIVTSIAHRARVGAYSFTMSQIPDAQNFDITLGQVISADNPSGAGRIEFPGAVDKYHFTIPSGGTRVYFQSLSGCACAASLREDATNRILQNIGNDASFGPMFLPGGISGTPYTLTIRGSYPQVSGLYSFKLWQAPAEQTFNFPNFPTTPITVSNNVPSSGAGNIEMAASADVYTFPLPAASVPSNVQISLTGNCGGRYTLIAPSGLTLVDKSCSSGAIVRLTEVGTAASPYRLVVTDFANAYSLTVQATASAATVSWPSTKFNVTLKSATDPIASRTAH